jgi:hypothetical protein
LPVPNTTRFGKQSSANRRRPTSPGGSQARLRVLMRSSAQIACRLARAIGRCTAKRFLTSPPPANCERRFSRSARRSRAGGDQAIRTALGAWSSCERPRRKCIARNAGPLKIQSVNNGPPLQVQESHAAVAGLEENLSVICSSNKTGPGKPRTGAQFVSFNFLNPLIWHVPSRTNFQRRGDDLPRNRS